MKIVSEDFYVSEDVVNIAKRLLGKIVISEVDSYYTSGIIVETEAYRAPEDKASHAYGNKKTDRTITMFSKPGIAYIYLVYGFHHLFNVVTAPKDIAHAVLVRAVEPIEGIDTMLKRRKKDKVDPNLTNGPGKWTQAFGITTALNGMDITNEESLVRIYSNGLEVAPEDIIESVRVGVDYAQEWAKKPWRFRMKGSGWVGK